MIDSHTHLDVTPGSDAEIVERARAAGVTRILTVGTDADSARAALGVQESTLDHAAYGAEPGGARTEKLPQLFPKPA